MMASERVRFLQNLRFRKRVFFAGALVIDRAASRNVVDFDGRGARSRDEVRGSGGEGEDVCWVGGGDGVGLEVLF